LGKSYGGPNVIDLFGRVAGQGGPQDLNAET
jgi:hypothetical protein